MFSTADPCWTPPHHQRLPTDQSLSTATPRISLYALCAGKVSNLVLKYEDADVVLSAALKVTLSAFPS